MNWLILLSLAVIIAAIAAVTGIKPKETRPVAHSRMMGMARFVLVSSPSSWPTPRSELERADARLRAVRSDGPGIRRNRRTCLDTRSPGSPETASPACGG